MEDESDDFEKQAKCGETKAKAKLNDIIADCNFDDQLILHYCRIWMVHMNASLRFLFASRNLLR